MDDLVANDRNAIRTYGSWFAFDAFGESNVDFWLFMQASDRLASFNLQSALIKNLHRQFREEGIVINYPVRTLQFPDGFTPDMVGATRTPSPPRHSRPVRPPTEEEGPDIGGVPPGGGESPMGTPDGPDGPG
jgi:small-conductance mechanosensitive channel